jgi:hypothetical protein
MSSSADLTVSISPECQIRQCRDLISALVQRRKALGMSLALITKDGEVLKPGSPDEAALSNLVPFYQRHVLFSD